MAEEMPRIQEVILPVLREELGPKWPGLMVTSWVPNVEKRRFPLLNVRRLGGLPVDVELLDRPVVEITAFTEDDLPTTEKLLQDARLVLWRMWKNQTVTPAGYIHSYFETMGPTQFDSGMADTWRVQMLVQLGLRPIRN